MPSLRLARSNRSHARLRALYVAGPAVRGSAPTAKSPARRRCSEISEPPRVRGWWLAALILLAAGLPAAAADKVDVVQLRNGDRLTCEIKRLDRSILAISTDPVGSVSVHWGDVANLVSPRSFDVQVASGLHYYGSLVPAPAGQLGVAS